MREAVAMPGEIVARLGQMLAERDRRIAENFAGLQALAGEFHALRDTVDVISQVADKAFFLAINASVEAHHQGRAGLAFGLIATEMRSLASQTADGARQVGQAFTPFPTACMPRSLRPCPVLLASPWRGAARARWAR
jgi:methyl-accepting chemotaxis protein